jgi:Ulp1 family protease
MICSGTDGKKLFDPARVKAYFDSLNSCDILVFPLHHYRGLHWRVCVFNKKEKSCIRMDSLRWKMNEEVLYLKKLIQEVCGIPCDSWKDESPPWVKTQSNSIDCGIHMLIFVIAVCSIGSVHCLRNTYKEKDIKNVRLNCALFLLESIK